jgi:predicted ribosomally synthesized peptide with nif11-like leader
MSLGDAKRFLDAVSQDRALQQKLGGLEPAEAVRRAIQAGAERGLTFTAAELQASGASLSSGEGRELSDDQLESVAGGTNISGFSLGGFLRALFGGDSPQTPQEAAKLAADKAVKDSRPPS